MKTQHVNIELVGNKGKLSGSPLLLKSLYDKWRIKHPNAFMIMKATHHHFDGYIKFISDYGDFRIGLLPQICKDILELRGTYTLLDSRLPLEIKPEMVYSMGKYDLRDLQKAALKRFIHNRVGGIPFYIGVMNCSTNFGKTLLMAAIHQSFGRKLKTLVLINNSNIFKQAKSEYKDYLPGEDIKFIQGKDKVFGNFNVGMVQSIAKNIKQLKTELSKIDIVLVDEADVSDNKSYKSIMDNLYNTRIRLGLSGSIYLSKLKKDQLHNTNIMSFFGDEMYITTKEQMVKKGYSTKLIIKICKGNDKKPNVYGNNYLEVYKDVIIKNPVAHECSIDRALYNIKYNRLPAIVVTKFIEHSKVLFEAYMNNPKIKGYRVARLDHTSKDKDYILSEFKKGNVDVLIVTYIIKRGMNLPLSVYLQNASGSDSEEDILQLMGRMERTHKGKSKAIIDDLYYYGDYVERHSKHRINYYRKTKMKVINLLAKGRKKK